MAYNFILKQTTKVINDIGHNI